MGLRGEDMLSECFARSADVATANAVVRIIPSPPLNPLLGGDFLSRAVLAPGGDRRLCANNSIAARGQVRVIRVAGI